MSYDMIQEKDIPSFQKRIGDVVFQGSNNSIIILGTDRAKDGPATIDDGVGHTKGPDKGKKTGTIHVIAGRADKDGNPDFKKDSSFAYLTMKSKVDDNLNVVLAGDVKVDKNNDVPAAVLKSDHVRIMARKNLKVLTEDSKNFILMDKDQVSLSVQDGASYIQVKKGKTVIKIGSNASITVDGDGKNVTIDVPAGGQGTIKLVKDADEPIILGKTYRNGESGINGDLATLLLKMGPLFIAASSDPLAPVFAATWVAAGASGVGADMLTLGAKIKAFEAQADTYLSKTSFSKL